jgi:hypothetical protein
MARIALVTGGTSASLLSRFGHVVERTGLALTGGSFGLFVAAHVARSNFNLRDRRLRSRTVKALASSNDSASATFACSCADQLRPNPGAGQTQPTLNLVQDGPSDGHIRRFVRSFDQTQIACGGVD